MFISPSRPTILPRNFMEDSPILWTPPHFAAPGCFTWLLKFNSRFLNDLLRCKESRNIFTIDSPFPWFSYGENHKTSSSAAQSQASADLPSSSLAAHQLWAKSSWEIDPGLFSCQTLDVINHQPPQAWKTNELKWLKWTSASLNNKKIIWTQRHMASSSQNKVNCDFCYQRDQEGISPIFPWLFPVLVISPSYQSQACHNVDGSDSKSRGLQWTALRLRLLPVAWNADRPEDCCKSQRRPKVIWKRPQRLN